MKDIEEMTSVKFGQRKSDIHYINSYSNEGYTTNKESLEKLLRTKILEFRQQSNPNKSGYRSLQEYMEDRFYKDLTSSKMSESMTETFITRHVPSHTSLRNFANGGSLSMKYLDSIAYVFSVKYILANVGLDAFIDHVNMM